MRWDVRVWMLMRENAACNIVVSVLDTCRSVRMPATYQCWAFRGAPVLVSTASPCEMVSSSSSVHNGEHGNSDGSAAPQCPFPSSNTGRSRALPAKSRQRQ